MFHDCATENSQGEHLVEWAFHIFGECIYNDRGKASLIIGLVSIFFFAFAQFPQIYRNFKLKRLPGISPLFIFLWLLGDASNLIGCILSNQLPTQLYQAIYFVSIDCISFSQIMYIYCKNKRNPPEPLILNVPESDEDESDESNRYNGGERLYSVMPFFLFFLFFPNNEPTQIPMRVLSNSTTIPSGPSGVLSTPTEIIGYIIGWISALCYISSRIPQIKKNASRKSTAGLSKWMFFFTSSGNILYTLSLALMFDNANFVVLHLPWLLGALIPLSLDIIILYQFVKYRRSGYTLLSNAQ